MAERERGRESAKPALQLIALYNVRFPVDITRFAAATLSGPIGGGTGAGAGVGVGKLPAPGMPLMSFAHTPAQ